MAEITVNRTCLVREEVCVGSNPIGYTVRRNGIIYQVAYYPFEVNVTSGVANDAILDILNGRTVKSKPVLVLLNRYRSSMVIERLCSCCQNKKTVSMALAYLDRKGHIKVLRCPRFETRGRKPKLPLDKLGSINKDEFEPTYTQYAVICKQHYHDMGVLSILC